MVRCLVPQSHRGAGVGQTDTTVPRWKVFRNSGPRMICCLVPQSHRGAGVDQTYTTLSRWTVYRKSGPRIVCCLVPQSHRGAGADQTDTLVSRWKFGRKSGPRIVRSLVPQPRRETGADQDKTQVGPGGADGRNPDGRNPIVATVVRGQAARIGWPAPLVASFARWVRCSKVETLYPLVVCGIVRVAPVLPLLLESGLWPPYLCVSTREPLAPCRERSPALSPVWLRVPAAASKDWCCLSLLV